ncbi:MAG TPA: glycerophosphodiester phosphodiesterase [Pyrinomonadaceae bacterium]|nr:glycerophosphodiester phosphodiesterase [Pyrinomonadaceae bacterium]
MFRKILKWFGYFLLGTFVILGALYLYLAMQSGEKAATRSIFAGEKSSPLVIAHRGGGGLFPENTLEAFEYSARMGVDVLELDVHQTADGALVVMHDSAVDRTTDGRGQIRDLTLAALKKLDAGFLFTPDGGQTFPFRGRGITIPTLAEIFTALPEMKFNIEPKQRQPSIVVPLCALIRERKMIDKTIVGSFDQTTIDDFRRQCPEVATSASPAEVSQVSALSKAGLGESYRPPMQALQVPQKFGGWQIITKEFVADAHRRNLQVHVWTINDAAEMQSMIDLGVDGIMTDYPDRLLNLLNRTVIVK